MLTEVQFFAPADPEGPALNAPQLVDLGMVPIDPARIEDFKKLRKKYLMYPDFE